jgi:hypothetical protein
MAERPLRLPPSSSENSSSSTKRTLKERVRNALITGTAGGYLGGMLVPEGTVRVKVPALLRKALKMKRRKTVGIHGARAGVVTGALIGGRNKGERSETVDAVATGGDWKFEERKPLTPGQKAALAGGGVLTAGGLVLGTARGRNALRSAMAGGSALGGLLNKAPGGQPRRVRMMKVQQKRKDLSNVRAANKAVEGARAKFRAEALPKAPAEPTLGDAVKTVKKRMKRKVVKAVSNIGANPAETQLSAFIEDMTFSGLPKEVQKDVLRFVDAEKGTPMVHYGMTVKELIGKADLENLKAARKALGTLRASRAADEVLGKIKDGSKYVLLMNDRIVDGHHFLAKAERGGVTSSLNVLDLTPARLSTRQMSARQVLREFALLAYRTNSDMGTRGTNSDPKKAQWKALIGNLSDEQKAKLEKQHQNAEAGSKTMRDVQGVVTGGLVGQKLVREGRDRLTGRTTLYHGTDKETARKIKSGGGLKSADRAGAKGIADVVMDGVPGRSEMLKKSRKGAFLSHEKGVMAGAGQYAAQSAWLKEGNKPLGVQDVEKVMNAASPKEKGKAVLSAVKKKLSRDVMPYTHRHKGKVLKYRVPLWRKGVQKNLMPNPEAEGLNGLIMDPTQRTMLTKRTKVFKNKVPEAYRVGSKNYKSISMKEWKQYAKQHPKRLLKGAGLVAGGAGLLAGSGVYAKKAWQERKARNEKLKEMSANAMLLNLFEEARERRNRTRDLRDKIGLAKDVAGLAGVTAAGVGGVKLYRAGQKAIKQTAPQVKAAARAWHRAGVKTGKTLDTVKDAVAPAAATNRGIKAVGSKIGAIARKATMWMHDDPRPVRQFQVSGSKFQEGKRSKMQNVRDAALTAAGATVAGVGVAGALKAREAGKVADNIRNTTAIGADVGKVYRKARKVVTDSADAFKGGLREAAGKPAPSWAKKAVRVGKKLRLLESRVPSFKFQVSSSKDQDEKPKRPWRAAGYARGVGMVAGGVVGNRAGDKAADVLRVPHKVMKKGIPGPSGKRFALKMAGTIAGTGLGLAAGEKVASKLKLIDTDTGLPVRALPEKRMQSRQALNEFIIGALGTIAGTLAGSAAGNKFRYPVQNALKKWLVPKLGVKWGRRVARAGAYIPENAGSLAGGAAGSLLTGGMRKRKAEEEQFQVPSSKFQVSEFNARALRALHEFGGREQLKDIDSSGFLDPLDVFVGRKKGYTAEQVKDYNRQKRYISDVKSGKRKGTPEAIKAAEDLMRSVRDNPTKAAHGQVVRSVLRKGDTVRKVSERGGGLIRDAAKELRGEGREKDRWGREKKREWEKPWFQRTKSQVIGAAALGGGALLLRKNPKIRAKVDRAIRVGKRKVNSVLPDLFPDAKPLRKPGQKTTATVQAKQQQAAQAKAAKTQAQVAQAAQSIAAQAAAVKKAKPAAAPKPAAKSPAPAKPAAAPAAVKPAAAPVLRTAAAVPQKKAASKPAVVKKAPAAPQVKAAPKPQAPPANTQEFPGSAWGASKLANEPKPLTAAEKAAKPKPKPKGRGKNQFEAAMLDLLTQFAEKPFDGYNSKRHARTGGLNDSFRKSYNRQHGANLKRPVTTKPSKLKAGSEAAGRRKSFCARMGGMPGATSKGGKLTPKGAALQRWNCMAIQALTQFADPLDVGWDLRDARGNSARVFAPQAGQRDRRPKRWHERVENERKLWAGAALTSTLAGGAAMRKLLGRQSDKAVKEALKRQAQQIGTAVKKRYVKKAASGGGGKAPNVVRFDPAA